MSVSKAKPASGDDLSVASAEREENQHEKVQHIALTELYPFPKHPFKVREDDAAMQDTIESIKQYGILVPAIVRPRKDGGYELVSGHRRHMACKLAGLVHMPVIVRNLDDDAATIVMVDSNLQREGILPSERAFAYKMKLDALKHQGSRSDLTSCQVGTKFRADEKMAETMDESARTIQRFIRLTNLIQPLLDMVDEKKIAFNPAVELSYLREQEQHHLLETIKSEQATPSLSQAQRLKKFSQDNKLSEDVILAIMSEEKKPEVDRLIFTSDTLKKYFPKSYTPKQMEDTILRLLENWQKHRKQEHSL